MSDTDTFERAQAQGLAKLVSLGTQEPPVRVTDRWTRAGLVVTQEFEPVRPSKHRASRSAPKRAWYAWLTTGPWPLLGILAIQTALTLRLIWTRSAFTDEALYLTAGRLEWAHWLYGTPISSYTSSLGSGGFAGFFSGAPVLYPPLAAYAAALDGVAGARLLSLAFMLGATVLLCATTRRIYGRRAAACACALFAVLGVVQAVSGFADYTSMAMFFIALAAWIAVRASWCRLPTATWLYAAAGVAMAFAAAAKYAAGVFCVFIVAAGFLMAWQRSGLRRAFVAGTTMSIVPAVVIALALHIAGPAYVRGVLFTTLTRDVVTVTAPQSVFWLGFSLTWGLVILGVLAAVLNWHAPWPTRLFYILLLVALLAPTLDQARLETWASLWKQVTFGAWFGAVAGGWVLAAASRRVKGWRIIAASLAVMVAAGYGQGSTQYGFWPNATALYQKFARLPVAKAGPILADQQWPLNYYLGARLRPGQVSGISRASVPLVRDHYYSLVEIDFSFPSAYAHDKAVLSAVTHTRGYRLIWSARWCDTYTCGRFRIWQWDGAR